MAYVYRFIGEYENEVIYVGYTGQKLENRMKQHFEKGHLSEECYSSISKIEYKQYKTKADAQLFEVYYINKFKGKYNKLNKQTDTLTIELEDNQKWKTWKVLKAPITKSDIKVNWLELGAYSLLAYTIYKILQLFI